MKRIIWNHLAWSDTVEDAQETARQLKEWSWDGIQTIFYHPRYGYAYVMLDTIEECRQMEHCIMARLNDEWVELKG